VLLFSGRNGGLISFEGLDRKIDGVDVKVSRLTRELSTVLAT
jgi:hypothetical protein